MPTGADAGSTTESPNTKPYAPKKPDAKRIKKAHRLRVRRGCRQWGQTMSRYPIGVRQNPQVSISLARLPLGL